MKLEDSLAAALVDQNPGGTPTPMGGKFKPANSYTADWLSDGGESCQKVRHYEGRMRRCALLNAVRTRLTRTPDYALRSQKRYAAALADGAFSAELTSVSLQTRKGLSFLVDDEHPRPQSTLESLASLSPVFIPSRGTVTAGNASGICDGAAANIVMSESSLKRYNVRPLARIASYAWSACEPGIMGIGPVAATREALRKAGKSIGEMDLLEINEVNGAPAALGRDPPRRVN